ncbi:ABC transporter ATP-binding protein [Methylocapsa sp. S129]|uniref:ABC transporter ATP-binding protein n=1 Tax=Methylocapsa sp. S129 TaxID=1641869 RepID=UPI00131AEAB2|nr:ABC transporter ATP-binding protein [Methylocapsa sp. S129]
MARAASFGELRFDRISRSFGTVDALRDVTLTIRKGEFIALLGPSGCGKSTTLNILAGLLPATGGGIWLDERRIDTLRPEERGFGMVFQNYALFPHMNVRRNIGFGLAMRHVSRAEIARRTQEAIALVRLEGHADKLPGQLSGGQQQRVAIARAIVIEPPLVLMDEPLSNLDAKLRLEMRAEIRRIHMSLGATTIYVTHDQEEALSLADRIVVMQAGDVRQVGTPDDLYARPASLDVAEFMGFRNRLSGEIVESDGAGASVRVGAALLRGVAASPLAKGARATLVMRTADLAPAPPDASTVPAIVTAGEFRGDGFVCSGASESGAELWFTSPTRLAIGEAVHLRIDPARARLYPADGA